MPVGITQLAHSLRLSTVNSRVPIPLSRGQQLVCAALGHKSLASFQAGQASALEPHSLEDVTCVVPDYELLIARAQQLGLEVPALQLRELINRAFRERLPSTHAHGSYSAMSARIQDELRAVVLADDRVIVQMANATHNGAIARVYFETDLTLDVPNSVVNLAGTIAGRVTFAADSQRPSDGNEAKFRVAVTVARLGRRCFDRPAIEVLAVTLDSTPKLNRPVTKTFDPTEQARWTIVERDTITQVAQALAGNVMLDQAQLAKKDLERYGQVAQALAGDVVLDQAQLAKK